MSKAIKTPLKIAGIGIGFVAVTFPIYFFNLDMKATALLAPFFEKWYDNLDRNSYI